MKSLPEIETIHAIDCDMGEDCTCNPERYRVFALCPCERCSGSGKIMRTRESRELSKCGECRGEGRVRREIGGAGTPEALGRAIVTWAREGEFEGCPIGVLDAEGAPGEKWLIRPWLPSARNVSDAGRVLAESRYR